MKRPLLFITGFLLLAVGGLGLFIPVLPTTPFVIAAASCFSIISPRLHNWLIGTRYFGPFIENYRNKTGVPKQVKATAIVFLWIMLIVSMALVGRLPIILLLAVVGICVTAHILFLKTAEK